MTNVDSIVVTIDASGNTTISGINYSDIKSILTAASLHRYDNPFKANPLDGHMDEVTHDNNVESAKWHLKQALIIDAIEARLEDAISPKYGNGSRKFESAKDRYNYDIKTIDEDVKEAEEKATDVTTVINPFDDIATIVRAITKQSTEVVLKLEQLAKQKS